MSSSSSSSNKSPPFGHLGIKYDKTVTCYVVGGGSRGHGYALMAVESPDALKVTGIAEPQDGRRTLIASEHCLENNLEYVTKTWEDLLRLPKRADFVIIATQDADHAKPAIEFMKRGYHVLVEKPMATTPEDCMEMVEISKKYNVMLGVCHILRYTPYTQKIHELVKNGEIGNVMSVQHIEPVGNWHFAHSYVRGNWRNEDVAAFILMAKSCHDVDWLRYVVGMPIAKVQCMGSLTHFKRAFKPTGAGDVERCVDCPDNVATDCPYNANGIYTERAKAGKFRFPLRSLVDGTPTLPDIEEAVKLGPYGRCVYECDNTQPDVITANIEFSQDDNGKQKTVFCSFMMTAATEQVCNRHTRISGSLGEIISDMFGKIKLTKFSANRDNFKTTTFKPKILDENDTLVDGHGGADWFMLNAFCAAVALNDPSLIIADATETLETHMATFAMEEARKTGNFVSIEEYIKKIKKE